MRSGHVSAVLAVALAAGTAHAVNVSWAAPVNGFWSDAGNWNAADIPDMLGESATLGFTTMYGVTLDFNIQLDELTISNPLASLFLPGGTTIFVQDGVVNNGLITINSNNSTSDSIFIVFADMAMTGDGLMILNRSGPDPRPDSSLGAVLTHGANHTIEGQGIISAVVENHGLISANRPGGAPLILELGAKTNHGIMRATDTGVLDIRGITVTQMGSGQIRAENGSRVDISSGGGV